MFASNQHFCIRAGKRLTHARLESHITDLEGLFAGKSACSRRKQQIITTIQSSTHMPRRFQQGGTDPPRPNSIPCHSFLAVPNLRASYMDVVEREDPNTNRSLS